MKRLSIGLLLFLINIFGFHRASAQSHIPLPPDILQFINYHFGGSQIVFQDVDAFDYSYIIQLDNGFETDFYRNGIFKLIDGQGQAVPKTILEDFPEALQNYLKENYPKEKIVTLRQGLKRDIEITFENKTTLKFDKYGKLLSKEEK